MKTIIKGLHQGLLTRMIQEDVHLQNPMSKELFNIQIGVQDMMTDNGANILQLLYDKVIEREVIVIIQKLVIDIT